MSLTGLPMVFAAWAGKPGIPIETLRLVTLGSYEFGKGQLNRIIDRECARREVPRALGERYLRRNIRFELGPDELRGMQAFFDLANLSHHSLMATHVPTTKGT